MVLLSGVIAIGIASFDSQQERQRTKKRNGEGHSRNHFCRGKAISITYSESAFVAFAIKHAMRMRRIILSSVASRPLQYFSHIIS